MSTELERLKTWMAVNGLSASGLAKRVTYSYSAIYTMLTGRRAIGDSFKFRFEYRIGKETARAIFDPQLSPQERRERAKEYKARKPQQFAAHEELAKAIRKGVLLPAKAYVCYGCHEQANDYHHESYHPNDHLCVVPLCRTCHRRHHNGRTPLTFGVVPTAVGVVRIAISNP